jgi:hypothetical protein
MGCSVSFLFSILLLLAALLGISMPVLESPLPQLGGLPCTVLTDRADVPVRVGPGENRSVRLFLPAGEPVAVIGRATADGTAWWQLDLEGIEQAWVSQGDVDAVGNCLSVPSADAPPVVPGGQTQSDSSSGEWGECGSCNSCLGPDSQCVTTPDGQCVWDATRCGAPQSDYQIPDYQVPDGYVPPAF